MTALAWAGAVAMDYRRQVTMRRDGDDSVVATYADGLIIFRNKDAAALRKLCRSLRWEIVRDTTASDDGSAWSLVPAESEPAETEAEQPKCKRARLKLTGGFDRYRPPPSRSCRRPGERHQARDRF
jgi:hypothetical protein